MNSPLHHCHMVYINIYCKKSCWDLLNRALEEFLFVAVHNKIMNIFHKNCFYFVLIRIQVVPCLLHAPAKINNIPTHSRPTPIQLFNRTFQHPVPLAIFFANIPFHSTLAVFVRLCFSSSSSSTTYTETSSKFVTKVFGYAFRPPCCLRRLWQNPPHPRLEIQFNAESHLNFYCCAGVLR